MIGDAEKAQYRGCSRPFDFPMEESRLEHIRLHRVFCHDNVVAVHNDCFVIFQRHVAGDVVEALARLWLIASWARPWLGGYYPSLRTRYIAPEDVLHYVAQVVGMPALRRCPIDVLEMIRQHDPTCIFWRAISTITMARRCSVEPVLPPAALPLPEIESWERGYPPKSYPKDVADADRPKLVLFTIDANGIRSIQRLHANYVPWSQERSDHLAFIFVDVTQSPAVTVCQVDGMLRITPRQTFRYFPLWDTPSPPTLSHSDWTLVQDFDKPMTRIRSLDLRFITGLTFFFWRGILVALHAHTPRQPTAIPTFERLAPGYQLKSVWIYVPVSDQDKLEVFGFRSSVAPTDADELSDELLAVLVCPYQPPSTMLYSFRLMLTPPF